MAQPRRSAQAGQRGRFRCRDGFARNPDGNRPIVRPQSIRCPGRGNSPDSIPRRGWPAGRKTPLPGTCRNVGFPLRFEELSKDPEGSSDPPSEFGAGTARKAHMVPEGSVRPQARDPGMPDRPRAQQEVRGSVPRRRVSEQYSQARDRVRPWSRVRAAIPAYAAAKIARWLVLPESAPLRSRVISPDARRLSVECHPALRRPEVATDPTAPRGCWSVGRTYNRLGRCRWLSRDFERAVKGSLAWVRPVPSVLSNEPDRQVAERKHRSARRAHRSP